MVTKFCDKIVFQQQPTYNTCVSTCLAMILNCDVQELIPVFHEKYYDAVDNRLKVTDFLKEKGVPFELCNFESMPEKAGVYLVTVPSLNIKGGTHQILWIMEESDQEGYFYQRIFDPATGREDRFFYTDIEELLNSNTLATKLSGYALDLHIPAEYFIDLYKPLTPEEIKDLEKLEKIKGEL